MHSNVRGLGLMKPQCFICFSSETGKRWEDHFVTTKNGHPFHYCCIQFMMVDGITTCPACDEDLRYQELTPINPTVAPVPMSKATSCPPSGDLLGSSPNTDGNRSKSSSSLVKNVAELLRDCGKSLTKPSRLSLDSCNSNGSQGAVTSTVLAIPVVYSVGYGGQRSTGSGPEREVRSTSRGSQIQMQEQEPTAPQQNSFAASDFQCLSPAMNMNIREPVNSQVSTPTVPPRTDFSTAKRVRGSSNSEGLGNHRDINVMDDNTIDQGTLCPDYTFKIVFLGDASVGKSSILRCFTDEPFNPDIRTTIGCDLRVKIIEVANKTVRLNLWDTAGQERYRQSLVGSYLRNADGIIMCYSITEIATLVSIQDWNEFAMQYAPIDAVKILVGNKVDLRSSRALDKHHASEVASLLNSPYLFCSAKDSCNVEAVFRTLTSQILERRLTGIGKPLSMQGILRLGEKSKNKKKEQCC